METDMMNNAPVNGEKEISTIAGMALTMAACAGIYLVGKSTVKIFEWGVEKTINGIFLLKDKIGSKKNKKK